MEKEGFSEQKQEQFDKGKKKSKENEARTLGTFKELHDTGKELGDELGQLRKKWETNEEYQKALEEYQKALEESLNKEKPIKKKSEEYN